MTNSSNSIEHNDRSVRRGSSTRSTVTNSCDHLNSMLFYLLSARTIEIHRSFEFFHEHGEKLCDTYVYKIIPRAYRTCVSHFRPLKYYAFTALLRNVYTVDDAGVVVGPSDTFLRVDSVPFDFRLRLGDRQNRLRDWNRVFDRLSLAGVSVK